MPNIIYRVRDRLIAGYCDSPQPIELEIDSICNSELGGSPGDYATVWADSLIPGKDVIITADHTVEFIDNPQVLERERVLASAVRKLQALGLTAAEVQRILR